MSSPDYPLLVVPSHDLYQLAHIASYIADALVRHRSAPKGRHGREERADAVRAIAGGQMALENAIGSTAGAAGELPRPIDAKTFKAARELLSDGPRWAEVASLAATGGTGWAVVGHVPGMGPVGAQVPTPELANAMRQHFLTQPAGAIASWAVTSEPMPVPAVSNQVDLAAFVEHLDPSQPDARAVGRHLRGLNRRTDVAIRGRFSGVDLDAPIVVEPPAPPRASTATAPASPDVDQTVAEVEVPSRAAPQPSPIPAKPQASRASQASSLRNETGLRWLCGTQPHPAKSTAPSVPASSAGP